MVSGPNQHGIQTTRKKHARQHQNLCKLDTQTQHASRGHGWCGHIHRPVRIPPGASAEKPPRPFTPTAPRRARVGNMARPGPGRSVPPRAAPTCCARGVPCPIQRQGRQAWHATGRSSCTIARRSGKRLPVSLQARISSRVIRIEFCSSGSFHEVCTNIKAPDI